MAKTRIILLLIAVGINCAGADPLELDLTAPPCEWKPVIDALAANSPVKSAFEETRTNPFQKRPRRFKGNIFWHPEHGLSLHYSSPAQVKINISEQSVYLFRQDEPPRRINIDGEDPALSLFFRLFDWDTEWLAESFLISGELEQSGWQLQLRPLDESARRKLSRIDLNGSGKLLQSIRLDFPGGREVRIRLFEQEYPWQPGEAFLKAQFEDPDDEG